MRAIEKRLRERLKEKDEELAELRIELKTVEEDRAKFRMYIAARLKSAIETHGKNQYWCMNGVIESLAKFMQTVKHWYW
jgi:acetyl-CoA carboxylase alpha subunit